MNFFDRLFSQDTTMYDQNEPEVDDSKFTVFNLAQLAFISCSDYHKNYYYKYFKNVPIGLDCECSIKLLNVIKKNSDDNFDYFGQKRNMFRKFNESTEITEISNVCNVAAKNGHLNCLKMAREMGCPWHQSTSKEAAANGQLECLIYMRKNGFLFSVLALIKAIKGGHLDCTKYLYECGMQLNGKYELINMCAVAAVHGHMEILKYAREKNIAWNELTCSQVASSGNLECLKYVHESGCPWDERTCSVAARHGHLNCLQYAHEQGCPWEETTCSDATRYGQFECLKYAVENGCSVNVNECNFFGEQNPVEENVVRCVMYIKSLPTGI